MYRTAETEYVVEYPARDETQGDAEQADWFTYGLPERAVLILLYQFHCSMPSLSMSFYSGDEPSLPTHLIGITGFTHPNDEHIKTTIRAEFLRAPILGWTAGLVRNNPDFAGINDAEAEEVAKAIIQKSLDAKSKKVNLGGKGLVLVTDIYMNSPTRSAVKWVEWRKKLSDHTKFAGRMRASTTLPLRRCSGCHSSDHVRDDCLYPHQEGWHDPAGAANKMHPQTTTNASEIAPAMTQAAGPSVGRGGGRGGGYRGQPWMPEGGARGMGCGRGGPIRSQQYFDPSRGRGNGRGIGGRQR